MAAFASKRRGSSLGHGLGRSMLKVLLLLALFAGLLVAAPTKSGLTVGPAVKPKRDPTHPITSAMKLVAKGSGGGDFARKSPQLLQKRLGMS